ncbi:hypothetical protein [Hutsoniella sourekii]|uniref:hypothetical protein n=1 Tax=Hutsoniella sourekii TaxID=87650 RepID=UPI0004893F4D|nr:hypothetical protein [Hutsoniella sourekii]
MAVFNSEIKPQAGTEQAWAIANNKGVIFTKLQANGVNLTDLKMNQQGKQVTVSGQFNNQTMRDNFTLNNLKLYAKVDGRSEFLFAEFKSTQGDVVPAKAKQPFLAKYSVTVVVAEQANVGITYTDPKTGRMSYAQTIGNGTAKEYVVNHGLGTRDVIVQMYQTASPYEEYLIGRFRQDANSVKLVADRALKSNEFRVVVMK